jgi:hypothetical protein
VHTSHAVDPCASIKRPAKHAAQADEPDELEYCPTEQAEQTSTEVAPRIELELPGKHSKHSVEPSPETYVPAAHRPHSEDPNKLAKLPGVHCSQTDTDVAPSFIENVPREHISQADVPILFPQLPAVHNAH